MSGDLLSDESYTTRGSIPVHISPDWCPGSEVPPGSRYMCVRYTMDPDLNVDFLDMDVTNDHVCLDIGALMECSNGNAFH